MNLRIMTSIKGSIPDDLDAEFRREVARRCGMRRGALSEALEQAIRQWIDSNDDQGITRKNEKIVYSELKSQLIKSHPEKYCIIKENEAIVIADSIIEATKAARSKYPEYRNFKIIHTVPKGERRAQLGWRIRRKAAK